MTPVHKIRMAHLARIDQRMAELDGERAELQAQRAKIWDEMAEGESVTLKTGRRPQRPHRPAERKISDTDMARADAALQEIRIRRRVAG